MTKDEAAATPAALAFEAPLARWSRGGGQAAQGTPAPGRRGTGGTVGEGERAGAMSGLVLVMLYVRDLARAETFYREMLGLRRIEQFSSAMFAFLKPPASTPLALQPVSEMPASMTAQPGATQLGFAVADVDAAYAGWKAKGATWSRGS